MAYWRKRELFIDIAFRAAAITEPPKAVTPPAKKTRQKWQALHFGRLYLVSLTD
jgi:hypothetical protein